MALENFTTEAYEDPNDSNNNYPAYTKYYWYYNAYRNNRKMPDPVKDTSTDFGTGYTNTGTMIRIWNNNGEEEGWIAGATQNKRDIWKHIQTKYQEGWYIPSRGEWAAFDDYFMNETDLEPKLTTTNYYSDYGLSYCNWTSSQKGKGDAWHASFATGTYVPTGAVDADYSVRLGATF